MTGAPAEDVLAVRRRRLGQAVGALLHAFFATVAFVAPGERDLRADGVVVVRGEVVGDAQALRQAVARSGRKVFSAASHTEAFSTNMPAFQ